MKSYIINRKIIAHTTEKKPLVFFLVLFFLGLGALAARADAQKVEVTFPDDSVNPLATLKAGHPRLFASAEQFEAIAKATSDPLHVEVNQRVIATAEATIKEPLTEYKLVNQQLLAQSRAAFQRIVVCSMAYRLTHDVRFANRAKQEMLNVAGFKDWNPVHFLDVGELAMAVGIGYDWCYDALSADERTTIKKALMEKALVFVPQVYGKHATDRKDLDKRLWWAVNPYNWNQVCHAGLLTAALALADEEPETARQVVQGVRAYLPISLHSYAPDGAWAEGPGYWGYGTGFAVMALSALESSLGTDFGLGKVEPTFAKTALFRLQMEAPNGVIYNYADVKTTWESSASPALGWLANRFGPSVVAAQLRASLTKQFASRPANKEKDRMFALHALWLPVEPKESESAPLDMHFRGEADVAVFRSAWKDPEALYLGFKNGQNGVNHAHLDLGSFLLDADGVRWSAELGSDNYGMPQYFGPLRWTYYRLTNYGHSTITPGDTLQATRGLAPIYSFESTPGVASAIADLSAVYPGSAKTILRGVFVQNRARVLVQDDITDLAPNTPLNWRMITAAKIDISKDGRVATLTQQNKTLRVELLSPADGTFSIASALPPKPEEDQNEGYSILLGNVAAKPSTSSVRIAVLLTPVGPKWPANLPAPKLEALPLPTP